MSVNVCPDDIFLTAEHFVTKLVIVVHHYELECTQNYWFAIFKVKVTARAHMIKMTVSTISSELLILLLPNLLS